MTQLQALLLTWLLELPIALLVCQRRDVRLVVAVVVASALTHPLVWLIGTSLPRAWWWPGICLTEAVVGVVEGLLLWRLLRAPPHPLPWRQALLAGVLMNAFSFGAGLVISAR